MKEPLGESPKRKTRKDAISILSAVIRLGGLFVIFNEY